MASTRIVPSPQAVVRYLHRVFASSKPPLQPLLIPDNRKKNRKKKAKKGGPAVVFHDAKTEQETEYVDIKDKVISELRERLEHHEGVVESMQELVDCARGSALVLRSLYNYGDELGEHNTITEGLARALKIVADNADVTTFGSSSGELCDSVRPDKLIEVLEAKIAKLREKAAPKDEPENTPEAS